MAAQCLTTPPQHTGMFRAFVIAVASCRWTPMCISVEIPQVPAQIDLPYKYHDKFAGPAFLFIHPHHEADLEFKDTCDELSNHRVNIPR